MFERIVRGEQPRVDAAWLRANVAALGEAAAVLCTDHPDGGSCDLPGAARTAVVAAELYGGLPHAVDPAIRMAIVAAFVRWCGEHVEGADARRWPTT